MAVNKISDELLAKMRELFASGEGIRATARILSANKCTVNSYHRKWVEEQLQKAYDLLWDGDDIGCDAMTANLPSGPVREMLDAWLDDQDERSGKPKSKWH